MMRQIAIVSLFMVSVLAVWLWVNEERKHDAIVARLCELGEDVRFTTDERGRIVTIYAVDPSKETEDCIDHGITGWEKSVIRWSYVEGYVPPGPDVEWRRPKGDWLIFW